MLRRLKFDERTRRIPAILKARPRTHSQIGADTIWRATEHETAGETVGFLRTAIDIARYHQERRDGAGYPSGLRGQAIRLSARLDPSGARVRRL